tara:strand:+ start:1764 stop:2612 length:849 start_codon:yes stop_codon:yes gene_type:complete
MVDLPNLVASAIENERSGFSTAVLLSNNSRMIMKIRDVLPPKMRLKTITSSNKVSENLKDSNIDIEVLEESLSAQGLSILNNLHDIILQGLGEGRFKSTDKILAILGEPMNGVIAIEASNLTSNRLATMSNEHEIDIEILSRLMELARHIGSRGREGHAVGALFAIGSVPKLRRYTTALVLNPFKGHSDNKKSVTDSNNHETLAEFAWLDGAILFNSKGIASDAGRYVQVPSGISPKPGEGGRHLAARAISQLAEGIAICVSSSGVITLYSKGREKYRVRLS